MNKYLQVYTDLKNQIEKNEITVGENLPSESELMNIFNVSRDTVRKALGMLVNQGYIQKARGKVAVVSKREEYKFPFEEIASFKELNVKLKRKTETYVENLEIVFDKEKILSVFNDDKEKEIYDLLRIRKIDGDRVIIDHDYFKRSIVPNLPLRACKDSVYEYLEKEQKIHIKYAAKEIFVEDVTDIDRKYIDMKKYNMVIVVKSYTYTKEGDLFQYTESRHRPDHFRFIGYAQRKG